MSRGLTSAMRTAIAAGTVYPILFGEFDFFGGTIYVCTNNQSITWNGHTWLGMGNFVSVEPVKESLDVSANNVSFSLSGIPSTLLTEVFTLRSRGRPCLLWFGCFTSAGALISDPQLIFSGRMDQPTLTDQGQESVVSISAESRLIDLQRARQRRYTDQDQRTFYPTDGFFKFITGLQDLQVLWGNGGNAAPSSGGGIDHGPLISSPTGGNPVYFTGANGASSPNYR